MAQEKVSDHKMPEKYTEKYDGRIIPAPSACIRDQMYFVKK